MKEGLLSLREAAELLSINPTTLRRWSNEGRITFVRINKRGDRRYRVSDLQSFIRRSVEK
jgi:transcriptional repressor of dcmA and dcmR